MEGVQPGDLLIVPHLPARGCVSVHTVGNAGLVAGSSATSALPLGFVIVHSEGMIAPLLETPEECEALIAELPFPTGPITPLTTLGPNWSVALRARL